MSARWLRRSPARHPLHVVAGYRLVGRRPPARYDGWLRADVDARLHPLCEAGWTLVVTLPVALVGARLWPGGAIGLYASVPAMFVHDLVVSARGRGARRARLFGSEPDVGPCLPYRTGV